MEGVGFDGIIMAVATWLMYVDRHQTVVLRVQLLCTGHSKHCSASTTEPS